MPSITSRFTILSGSAVVVVAASAAVAAVAAGGFRSYREPADDRERQMSTLAAEPQRRAIERACELQAFGADDHL